MDAPVAMDSGARLADSHRLDMSSQHDPSQPHRGSSQSDGRDAPHVETPLQHHLHPRSSPAAASVDSFSSYINKDAALFHNRSSSPRAEDQLRDHSDPASHAGSPRPHPRHLVTTPVISRDAFRNQHWADQDLPPRASNGVMSIEHLYTTDTTQLPRPSQPDFAHSSNGLRDNHKQVQSSHRTKAVEDGHHPQHVPASPSPAIDVNRLSVSNLAQKNQEDDVADPSYRDAHMRAAASILADDSFESTASVMGEDAKNEIRRRRRTRPDEANLLAEVYAKNPFPDHETRLFLANRVGMSVRAVSVWFQNRRQAEKKRSGRYGGSGIAPGASTVGNATPASEESPARPTAVAPVVAQRQPLGNVNANAAGPAKTFDPSEIKDLSNNNKENIPPWLVAGRENEASPLKRSLEKIQRDVPLAVRSLSKQHEVIAPVARDLRQAVGPQGVGITAHRAEIDTVPSQATAATSAVEAASSSKTALLRHRSVPRLSLDDVLSGRSKTFRRSATEHAAPLATAPSSQVEEEQLDTILPPPKLLSRASSSSSLSLLTTSGGRASIGNFELRKEASPAPQPKDGNASASASLTSALPPKLTAALQRQGIIAMHPSQDTLSVVQGKGLLQMMPSSSASSSDADYPPHNARQDSEEDEERTLKLIAQRRAAKAQASALAKAQAAREKASASSTDLGIIVPMDPGCADARHAIQQQAGSSNSSVVGDSSLGSISKKSGATVVGLPSARQLSLDWAAGRDRASTTALPTSIGGTPLSRSVSARQLSLQRMPSESTPLSKQQQQQLGGSAPTNGEKKSKSATAGRRSLSATDLTRRLQEAKRKGDAVKATSAAGRKRSAAAMQVGDENQPPAVAKTVTPAAAAKDTPASKRRKAQLEEVATSFSVPEPRTAPSFGTGMLSPMLSSRPFSHHSSFPSSTTRPMGPTMVVPSTPSSTTSYSTIPLSTRSDRYRAVGASPATITTTLGRSISANYPRHPPLPSRANRPWESSHTRTYSGEESWTPRSTTSRPVGMESLSQPLPITASTPSRVLGDRTNFGSSTPLMAGVGGGGEGEFGHDDSGFFEAFSDDDRERLVSKGKKVVSPRKASLRSMMARGGAGAEGDDHQAAELLLGLGKTVDSRDSSSSQ